VTTNYEDVSAPSPYGPPVPVASAPRAGVRRPLPALTAAIGVVVAYVVLVSLPVLASSIYTWASFRFEGDLGQSVSIAWRSIGQEFPQFVTVVVLMFLFSWGIAPIRGALRIGQVLLRSILTAVVTGLACGIVVIAQYAVRLSQLAAAQSGSARPTDLLRSMAEGAVQGVGFFAQLAPLVVVAALILWNWSRNHPVRTTPAARESNAPALV